MSSQNLDQRVTEVWCDVVAWSSYRASAADLPALRKSPGTLGDETMANGLLRHVDEQTVVGVAAVLTAVRDAGLDPARFGRWSVLAAPRYLGRASFEGSFPQYRAEGAWAVSPHLIPAHSLHSPSGTISQVLHAHGANLGVGGTPGGERDALLVAATWLEAGWSDGVWIILTSRDPAEAGEVAVSAPGDYAALALALVGSRPEFEGPRIQIRPQSITLETSGADQSARAALLSWLKPADGAIVAGGSTWRADAGHGTVPVRHARSSPALPGGARNTRTRELI